MRGVQNESGWKPSGTASVSSTSRGVREETLEHLEASEPEAVYCPELQDLPR